MVNGEWVMVIGLIGEWGNGEWGNGELGNGERANA
jgi:hypothetical protein